ncbi:MAG: rhomboid family intramembrane serine protease [Kiritimatiellia bacterium]|jgi:membrane associated rhomboid family serine protease|nr:rhomboid family intramembrane serine protease [Kiritimatiellia bacterium]
MSYRHYHHSSFSARPPGLFAHLPPVVSTLIKVNVAVFFVMWFLRLDGLTALLALSRDGLRQGLLWQPLTYMFLHGGFMHLLFNMFTLFFLGPETERAMGSRHFLAMYLLSGVLGGLGWIWLTPHSHALCVGASGAIFGVLAAFATLYPRRRLTLLIFFIFPVTMMAWQLVAGLALIEFMLASGDQSSGIAHTAHLAGAFTGFLYIDQLFESTHLRRLWSRVRDYVAQRPTRPRAAPPPPDQAEVDRILEKISAQGIQSLSRAERQTLHRASRTF